MLGLCRSDPQKCLPLFSNRSDVICEELEQFRNPAWGTPRFFTCYCNNFAYFEFKDMSDLRTIAPRAGALRPRRSSTRLKYYNASYTGAKSFTTVFTINSP